MKFSDYKVVAIRAALAVLKNKNGPTRAAFSESKELLAYYGRLQTRMSQAKQIPARDLALAFERIPGLEEELDRQEILHRDPASLDESINDPFAVIMRGQADGDVLSAIEELRKYVEQQFAEIRRSADGKGKRKS